MRCDAALYGTLQKTLYAYWGPPNVGAFVEIMAIAATLVLARLVSDRGSALWMTAGAAAALVIAFPIVFLRARREDGHVIRFAFHLCALGLLVLSVLIEMDA